MAGNRKDSKGRVLHKGEYERCGGGYHYKWMKNGVSHTIYAPTLKELRQKEEKVKKDLADGIVGGNITLLELIELNLEYRKLKPSTLANYRNMIKNNLQDSFLGKMKIEDIKQVNIKRYYKELVDKPLKKNSIKYIHNIIFSSFEMAVFNDMIRKNPAKNCMKDIDADKTEKIPLSSEQADKLIEFCKNHACYNVHVPFLTIALGTGMRIGEITGLRWNDVDLKNNTISVNHQLCYKNTDGTGCKFYVTTPKTEKANRIIPITDAVHDAFIELKKLNLMLGKTSQMIVDGYSGFCFLSANGSPLATNAINSFLYGIHDAYNKKHPDAPIPHLSAHILRHSACTIYSSAGMSPKALQGLLGHSNSIITEEVYDHATFERTQKEIMELNNVVNF